MRVAGQRTRRVMGRRTRLESRVRRTRHRIMGRRREAGAHGQSYSCLEERASLKGGGKASVRPNGSVRSIDRGGMHIEHGVRGGRTVVSERKGARIVTRGRGGYVQRAYVTRGGRSYYSRTYYSHGVYRALESIAATAGAGICITKLLPWSLVPSGILWMGLPALGSRNCMGRRRGVGAGEVRPWWGYYGGGGILIPCMPRRTIGLRIT